MFLMEKRSLQVDIEKYPLHFSVWLCSVRNSAATKIVGIIPGSPYVDCFPFDCCLHFTISMNIFFMWMFRLKIVRFVGNARNACGGISSVQCAWAGGVPDTHTHTTVKRILSINIRFNNRNNEYFIHIIFVFSAFCDGKLLSEHEKTRNYVFNPR